MTNTIPTRGQLERSLSQRIQAFYRQHLGHQPSKVSCQLFDDKVVVIIENSLTRAEQLLAREGQDNLVEQVRSSLGEAIEPQLKELIEEILKVNVTDLLSDATLETGRTGTIAVLAETPQTRNSTSNSKPKRKGD
ncbi:MAG: DUF2294 domain-containing protein [Cyanobacteriota bacterium]|nr:DUF2294 domain-containing protein [Cyanobacteriota bacterium]